MYWINNENLKQEDIYLKKKQTHLEKNYSKSHGNPSKPLGCLIRICLTNEDPCFWHY